MRWGVLFPFQSKAEGRWVCGEGCCFPLGQRQRAGGFAVGNIVSLSVKGRGQVGAVGRCCFLVLSKAGGR